MATEWQVGDEINAFLEGNFDSTRTPNNWAIRSLRKDENNKRDVFTIQHLVTRQERLVDQAELDAYFRLIRHTR